MSQRWSHPSRSQRRQPHLISFSFTCEQGRVEMFCKFDKWDVFKKVSFPNISRDILSIYEYRDFRSKVTYVNASSLMPYYAAEKNEIDVCNCWKWSREEVKSSPVFITIIQIFGVNTLVRSDDINFSSRCESRSFFAQLFLPSLFV